MQDKITVRELLDNWVLDNPHYAFWFVGARVVSAMSLADEFYVKLENNHNWYSANGQVIEIRPKTPQFTELQDTSDLDATILIDPRETAKRDHDRIVRLEAENAKMREFMNELCTRAPSQSAKYHIDNEVRDYHDVLRELGFAAAFILKELGYE